MPVTGAHIQRGYAEETPIPSTRTRYEDASAFEAMRRVHEMDFNSSTFLKGAGTHYDPIFTPIFAAIGFTGTITIGTATLGTTASLLGALATTAITAGIQMVRLQR